jgi:hypothetical protein
MALYKAEGKGTKKKKKKKKKKELAVFKKMRFLYISGRVIAPYIV